MREVPKILSLMSFSIHASLCLGLGRKVKEERAEVSTNGKAREVENKEERTQKNKQRVGRLEGQRTTKVEIHLVHQISLEIIRPIRRSRVCFSLTLLSLVL